MSLIKLISQRSYTPNALLNSDFYYIKNSFDWPSNQSLLGIPSPIVGSIITAQRTKAAGSHPPSFKGHSASQTVAQLPAEQKPLPLFSRSFNRPPPVRIATRFHLALISLPWRVAAERCRGSTAEPQLKHVNGFETDHCWPHHLPPTPLRSSQRPLYELEPL